MIIAEGIKKLYYFDSSKIVSDLTLDTLKSLIEAAKEVKNVHQDTWSIEETEPTRTGYKNELTGGTYRENVELGDVAMNFTIGQYDFETKADLMGGDATENSWKRATGIPNIKNAVAAITKDDVYVCFPKASISAREADTDKATGLAVVATALEHDVKDVRSEYWFTEGEEE